ncbi:MAG: hypothetical protein R2780_10285 [Crocinitomicaceae bacterium]
MKKLFLIAFMGSFVFISCKKVIDCRDPKAINFNPEADRACDACCTYESTHTTDTVFIIHADTIYVSPNGNGGFDPADLNSMELAFAGTWEGMVETPWTSPYHVQLTFNPNDTYSGFSTNSTYPAFYYGTDANSPDKVYDLTTTYNYNNQLAASGTIDIVFSVGTVNQDEILNVRFHDNLDSLRFDFIHQGQYGPLKYELNRM